MLQSIEVEINLAGYTLTEKKVFFTISQISENKESCNITDVIKESELSRSTVYKAMKKFEKDSGLTQNIKNIENNLEVIRKRVIKKYGKDSDQYKSIFEK